MAYCNEWVIGKKSESADVEVFLRVQSPLLLM